MKLLRESLLVYPEQPDIVARFHSLAASGAQCLERTCWEGHLTGSALITGPKYDCVLLTLHSKLGMWLQLGGHADGDADLARVALREAQEESGLAAFTFAGSQTAFGAPPIFDLDIHAIPARKSEPQHLHYDVRYLLIADPTEKLAITAESKDLRWLKLSDAYGLTQEPSMHRQFDKLARAGRELGYN